MNTWLFAATVGGDRTCAARVSQVFISRQDLGDARERFGVSVLRAKMLSRSPNPLAAEKPIIVYALFGCYSLDEGRPRWVAAQDPLAEENH
jgi:hypothetical protein